MHSEKCAHEPSKSMKTNWMLSKTQSLEPCSEISSEAKDRDATGARNLSAGSVEGPRFLRGFCRLVELPQPLGDALHVAGERQLRAGFVDGDKLLKFGA